jgi:putative hydrolase of the HAD superfamily
LPSQPYVFFDVDDTLVDWQVSWADAFAQVAREAGAGVTPDETLEALNLAFSTFYADYLKKHSTLGDEQEFWLDYNGRIFETIGVKQQPRKAAARVAKLLSSPQAIQLFPEVPEVLQTLSDNGARLAIVTGRPRARTDLDSLGILHYFEHLLDGLWAGEMKRVGSAQFAEAARIAAAARTPAWHVGDSYQDDVEGARAAGLRPVLVDRRGEHPDADCPRTDDLRPLPEIIMRGEGTS